MRKGEIVTYEHVIAFLLGAIAGILLDIAGQWFDRRKERIEFRRSVEADSVFEKPNPEQTYTEYTWRNRR